MLCKERCVISPLYLLCCITIIYACVMGWRGGSCDLNLSPLLINVVPLLVRLQAHRSLSQPSRTRCMVSEVRLRDPKPLVNTIEPDSQMATGNYTLPPSPLEIHSDQAGEKWKHFRRALDSYSLATGLSGKAENVHVATLLTTNLSLMYFPTLLMHALALHCVEYWKTCTMHFLLY